MHSSKVIYLPYNCFQVVNKYQAKVHCREIGNVKWMKDNKAIDVTTGDKYEAVSVGIERSLIVKDITKADKGKYTCTLGDSKTTAQMNVKGLQLSTIILKTHGLKSHYKHMHFPRWR